MATSQNVDEDDLVSHYEDALTDPDPVSTSDSKLVSDDEPKEKRESLGSKTSYLLTLIGYAVGFGNLWRFPYRLQTYGGVFLIPYGISVVLLGLPVLYLELAIGQRLRKGPVGAWNEVSPYMGGIGITSGFICLFIGFYYNTLIAYCISYLLDTRHRILPWENCVEALKLSHQLTDPNECYKASSPSKFYWFRGVLDVSDNIEELGGFRWEMYLYLLLAWFFVGAILIKGLAFTGKIVWFTACFPYAVLFIFLIFGWTLPGMKNGYYVMFSFDFEQLANARIWMDAASQIFFSLGVGCGVLISYSSYLPARNNVWMDSIVVTAVNSATSVLSCFVVFGILGFKGTENFEACHTRRALAIAQDTEHETCSTIEEYINESGEGTGLAFISFTEAIKKLPWPNLFNFMFFLMLLTLGIDSSFGTVEGTIASIQDLFPKLKRWMVSSFVVWILTLFCFLFAFGWGNHVLTLLDYFSVDYPLLSISLMECIAVGWVYGLGKFSYDLQLMTGRRPTLYILICIKYIAPLVMLTLIVANIALQSDPENRFFEYFPWNRTTSTETEGILLSTRSILLAFLVVFICVIWMPLVAILHKLKRPLLKEATPEVFPEVELRMESGFDLHPHLRNISGAERVIFGASFHDFPTAGKLGDGSDMAVGPVGQGSTEEVPTGSSQSKHQSK